jgi:hypothetical protein
MKKDNELKGRQQGNSILSNNQTNHGSTSRINNFLSSSPYGLNGLTRGEDKLKKGKVFISAQSLSLNRTHHASKAGNRDNSAPLDMKRIKKIFDKKVQEKEEKQKIESCDKLRLKLRNMVKKRQEGDIEDKYDGGEYRLYKEEEDEENFEEESVNTPSMTNRSNSMMRTTGGKIKFDDEYVGLKAPNNTNTSKKRRPMNQTHFVDYVMNDIGEEKVIVPKKKINHVGLKMLLQEELKKMGRK